MISIVSIGLLIFGISTTSIHAQNTISLEEELQPFVADSSYYLNEWVVPSSIEILVDGEIIPVETWAFNEETGMLHFINPSGFEFDDESIVKVRFDAYPLTLRRSYQVRTPIELDSTIFDNPDSLGQEISALQSQSTFDESNLRQSGSLSRGVIVGTNQDFSLESGLNFELNGALTENIHINASLTDQNIPIQPDGTTQNLREFDQVFIQVEAPNTMVEMGDVDINLEQSTFARLNRRLQGAAGYTNTPVGDYGGALSVVRGTYKSVSFSGEEGVQGPYRLTGRNNEEFVIILAGTERVYINGQRVQRGAENEYIIDYGLGEVFFTGNLLVKDETRILIEYEYVDQNFNRTMIAAEGGDELFDGKLRIGATVIRQADGDDLLSQQSLTENDIEVLRAAGDNLEDATISGARIADEREREEYVLYAEVDTMVNGETFRIYQHQPNSPEAIYRVRFSDVGNGEGSYRRISGDVNGLLYEWVGPGRGKYESFQQLPAPQKQQMVALNGRYSLTDKFEVFGEWAVSDFDQNRFSSLDNDDNTDIAYESGLRMNEIESPFGILNAQVNRRYSGRRFEFFERTRDVEFDRKWNITRTGQSRESINEAMLNVSPSSQTSIGGEVGLVERDDFVGIRQASSIRSTEPNWFNLTYNQDLVQSEDDVLAEDGRWFRQNGRLSKDLLAGDIIFTPYLAVEQENRIQRNTITDTLSQRSQSYYDAGPGIRIGVSDFQIDAAVAYRSETGVLENELRKEFSAIEQRYEVLYRPSSNFETINEVKIRNKNYTEDFAALGNINRQGLFVKSVTSYMSANEFIDGEVFYQANTQRQAVLQETYVRVGSASGQYVWRDTNEDGVQQVDEFFQEVSPNEGLYIRRFLPSDELFPVVFLNLRTKHNNKPFQFITSDEDNWLSGINLRSRIDISENSTTENLRDVYLVKLRTFRNDSSTVQGRLLWEKELDMLQNVNQADLRFGYNQNRALNQRAVEAIRTYTDLFYLNSSLDVTERVRILMDSYIGKNKSISSRISSRNYNINSYNIRPGIDATINRSWNTAFHISYTQKEDFYPAQNVRANMIKLENTNRIFLFRKLQSNLRVELRRTLVNGSSSTYGSYELTEGTGEGTNLIWSLNSTYRISNLIRFSLDYDGRTVENLPAIHTIKLVMSAVF
ncbi:MAG: hypothetical protein WD059_07080 [Balneolaceae bacterium]